MNNKEVNRIMAQEMKKTGEAVSQILDGTYKPVGETIPEENDVFERQMAAAQKRYQELVGDPNTSYADAINHYMECMEQIEAIEATKPSANRTRK